MFPIIEHRDILPQERHAPYNWLYADATHRTVAQTFVPSDIGKWAYQSDERTIWALLSYGSDGVPVWGSVGGSPGGGDKYYVHVQNTPATLWTVLHSLSKHPSITIIDSAGDEVEGDVHYDSDAQATLTFSAPFSGTAVCN